MSNEKDLTHGNLWKQMMLFSLPLMLSNVLQVLFNLSDIFVVSNFGSANSLGSVGSTSSPRISSDRKAIKICEKPYTLPPSSV